MKLPLAYYGNPILRKKTSPLTKITDEIRKLVQDMDETMLALHGVGLASPQINQSIALFIIRVPVYTDDRKTLDGDLRVFINPKILSYSDDLCGYEEACLSIPGLHSEVIRPMNIKIEAMNLEGETFVEELTGLAARIFMHENDHLNGVLFIDRLPPPRKKEIEPLLRELKKKYQ